MTDIKRWNVESDEQDGPCSLWYIDAPNGDFVKYDDHAAIVAALQEQVQQLTEERDSATLQFDYMQDQINFHSEKVKELTWEKESALIECAAAKIAVQYLQHDPKAKFTLNTPKTDAVIREIGATGAEAVASYHKERFEFLAHTRRDMAGEHKAAYLCALDVAAKLRAGEQP